MSIRIITYPTKLFRPKYRLSDLSWSDISAISQSGDAPYLLSLGDSKDGATLVKTTDSTCVFSLDNLGQACVPYAAYPSGASPYPSTYSDENLRGGVDVTRTGWYRNSSYASGLGVTLSSVRNSLSSDIRSVMKTVSVRCRAAFSGGGYWTTSKSMDLYPPNDSEAMAYKGLLSLSGVYWLRDCHTYQPRSSGGGTATELYFNTYNTSGDYIGYTGFVDRVNYGGNYREGIETEKLWLLFEV